MARNKFIVFALADKDTTQIAVAKQTGISESRLSRIVNGHDRPTREEKVALAVALSTTVDTLFPPEAPPEAVAS
jgi:transcriptional regulator with XRE-family HTH domain